MSMLRGVPLLLSEKPYASMMAQSWSIDGGGARAGQRLASDPISDMGTEGSGDPWWIWIVVGVLVALLLACLVYALCRRKKKREMEQNEQGADDGLDQIIFQDASDGLGEPLIT